MRNLKMKQKVYSLYDSAVQAFTSPMFLTNDGEAIRAIQNAVNSEQETNLSKNPEHFTLFNIGEWDDKKAQIITTEPRSVVLCVELQKDSKKLYTNTDLNNVTKLLNDILNKV